MFSVLFSFVGLLCEEMVLFAAIAVIFFCIENFSWILLGILGVFAAVILITLIGKFISYIISWIQSEKEIKADLDFVRKAWRNDHY
ncbi:MAG: hypothetical protein MJ184_07915 [Treponema sp.]|uniref:hypothetical protein n=1 Tax=Treponema sp. TaxID=166 RepID=UPI00298E2B5E|nr:hypothetical protein [Treponema sp.]MCQ2601273.1 hypothetical protein [Treponema sp.]